MSDPSPLTGKLLALSMLRGIGPSALRKMAQSPRFETAGESELAELFPQLGRALAEEGAWTTALDLAEQQLELADKHSAKILSPLDADYPALLAATRDDPFIIFVQGNLPPHAPSVAVIGTREPTAHGAAIAQRITRHLVEMKWSVVSGLAIGCDSIAHQAALDLGGHTVAVLAHGLQTISPSRNKRLAADIIEQGGALVSEYRFGQAALPQQFVKRDRTQAGLAHGVVMIQSDLRGGSLHASRASLDYDRWLAVPYPTQLDRDNAEPKVQANLLICDGASEDAAALLRCDPSDLQRVIVLRSKADYEQLVASEIPVRAPLQDDLI